MLSNYLRLLLCASAVAVSPSFGWAFTTPDELEKVFASDESTLVACKLSSEKKKKCQCQRAMLINVVKLVVMVS